MKTEKTQTSVIWTGLYFLGLAAYAHYNDSEDRSAEVWKKGKKSGWQFGCDILPDICWSRCFGADIQMPACHIPLLPEYIMLQNFVAVFSSFFLTVVLVCHKDFLTVWFHLKWGSLSAKAEYVQKYNWACFRFGRVWMQLQRKSATKAPERISSLRTQSAVTRLQTGRKSIRRSEKTNNKTGAGGLRENRRQTCAGVGKGASLFVC